MGHASFIYKQLYSIMLDFMFLFFCQGELLEVWNEQEFFIANTIVNSQTLE